MIMFKRKIYNSFLEWKIESNGNTALLVEGARRVGKSTIVEEFGKREYGSYILIDFAFASPKIKELFNDLSDLNYFFRMLQFYTNKSLIERNSLIIFDEVQKYPKAREAIKILVKDHRYDYIETGSLLSIKENVKDIFIPSEERRIEMYPMDYEEFCEAIGEKNCYNMGKEMFDAKKSFGNQIHRTLMRNFRLYMIVGGMPLAVSEFLETNNFSKVDMIKRDIITLYENDFMKFDQTGKVSRIFDYIPAQLQKNASRYQVSSIFAEERASSMLGKIAKLSDSKTVNIAYNAANPEIGLSQYVDLEVFKLFLSDTGLFITLCYKNKAFSENVIYEKLLSDKLSSNLGYVYENVVAQILKAKGDELFYHTFPNENSTHSYEVDFIISRGNKICPLEVKSSGYSAHKSLDVFSEKHSHEILQRYLVYTKEYKKDGDVICLPVYMVPFI